MAEILTALRGRATVDVGIDGKSILAPERFLFISAARVDSVCAQAAWTLQLQAVTGGAYEQVMVPVLLSSKRELQVRWGIDVGTRVAWQAWETFRILTAMPDLHTASGAAQGCPFQLTLGDAFTTMDLDQRVAGHLGKISDLVTALAVRYGLEPRVEPTGDVPATLVQSYETDLHFLQRRLLPAAFNGNGQASYRCYVDQGALHFHTRGWQQAPWIVPYNLMHGGATFLLATDDAQEAARRGGQTMRTVAYDPLTGRTAIITADPQKYTRFAARLSTATATALRGTHVGPNQLAWCAAETQAAYSAARDGFERITFSMANAPALRAGLILLLQLPDAQASANGLYHVEQTELTIAGSTARTVVTADRGEVAGRLTDRTALRDGEGQALTPPASAPGVDPTFQVAQLADPLSNNVSTPVQPGGS